MLPGCVQSECTLSFACQMLTLKPSMTSECFCGPLIGDSGDSVLAGYKCLIPVEEDSVDVLYPGTYLGRYSVGTYTVQMRV
jgi:hypothetical protein